MVMSNIFVRTAIITTIIFAVGVWIGLWLGETKVNSLETTINNLGEDINNAELQFLLFDVLEKNASCNYMIQTANQLGVESGKMAADVERYENTQKIDDASFHDLKQKYTNTLIRNWVTLEKIKKTCDGKYTTILYFYSNTNCNRCEEQGMVLSYFKEKLNQNVLIFALDSGLGVEAVNVLHDSYGIKQYPAMVINGDIYQEFKDKADMTRILCNFNSNLSVC
jgi:hypothetical protein